ncbi:ADP-forming succinate--CoA ligase subunit beta [Desulfobacula toluolica]|uniref:Succinate--CoA ligase [ADP-forming] subunit beta n=1 Tax=Desulfobacula toluolica (strain DSM 7467 / Tol2) TaxID=651182 RepID=K0ND41_DESTT|nr:ADP-forming succinate--CoA ligase subunit beta [Desulfobacula toluolica]CCK78675.1 SucC: succinyl-CoA ligase [ADP-forming], beta subunit [Desulfobacula toluolica Tol2]
MKIHEYQAKELFRKYNVPVAESCVAFSKEEALKAANDLGVFPVVIKAQIHAGGRGKGGGVKLAANQEQVLTIADQFLGMRLVTHQTGPEGKIVRKVLVEAGQSIDKEFYLSLLVDRHTEKIVIMASQAGGIDIEDVAQKTPEKIFKVYVDPLLGIQGYQLREVGFRLGFPAPAMKQLYGLLFNLYKFFVENDASLVEINPLILTSEGVVLALDAKVDFDSNALYRHKDILELRDLDEEDPLEVEASKYNLNYVNLDGNVGNIVNGAGLAMATMDIIKNAGAAPANFMDVGGGATSEQVENAFRIILADPKVKAILINIFGGILRCDIFAKGVVDAVKKTGISVPVVVRMRGTNMDEGKKILIDSGLNFINAFDLSDAAAKIAAAVN